MTKNERFVYDAYRRFLQLFGKIGLGVPDDEFDKIFEEIKEEVSAPRWTPNFPPRPWQKWCRNFKDVHQEA